MKKINYKILDISQSYCNRDEVLIEEEGDKVKVSFNVQLPSPGYEILVKGILKDEDKYQIQLDIKPPGPGIMQIQMITYRNVSLEIQKGQGFEPPYNLEVM